MASNVSKEARMKEIFLIASAVCFIFYTIWVVMYPLELWESLTFRNGEGIKGHAFSIVTIVFLIGFVYFISTVVSLITRYYATQ